jgi:hypothetical protein
MISRAQFIVRFMDHCEGFAAWHELVAVEGRSETIEQFRRDLRSEERGLAQCVGEARKAGLDLPVLKASALLERSMGVH